MPMKRTTHSDLARLIEDHADRLKKVPAGYLVSDASTLRLLRDTARILVEQDQRIDSLTIGLREHGGIAARKYLT